MQHFRQIQSWSIRAPLTGFVLPFSLLAMLVMTLIGTASVQIISQEVATNSNFDLYTRTKNEARSVSDRVLSQLLVPNTATTGYAIDFGIIEGTTVYLGSEKPLINNTPRTLNSVGDTILINGADIVIGEDYVSSEENKARETDYTGFITLRAKPIDYALDCPTAVWCNVYEVVVDVIHTDSQLRARLVTGLLVEP